MATITTPVNLDDAARTAGEAWTINGGVLTIRTDTRFHAGSPASMLGSLASITISSTLGGGLHFDGTKVRWLAYTGGSGNVPAIGTTISRSGVSGPLLGVWSALNAAPTAVGAAMPATGFIKLREVTGGTFSAGALTGLTANASGADVTGWIEIVLDQVAKIVVPRLGYHTSDFGWFELGTTSGSAHQQIQTPTNGGGAATDSPGLYIETAPSSGVYEFWPAITVGCGFTTANLTTDARARFVNAMGSGICRIGGDGTNAIGALPPSGCKIRIPNIICRQTSSANRALNLTPHTTYASRPTWTTTSAGALDLRGLYGDWYLATAQAYSLKVRDCVFFDASSIANTATALDVDGYYQGLINATTAAIGMLLQSNTSGGTVKNVKAYRRDAAASGYAVQAQYNLGVTLDTVHAGIITLARNASGYAMYINQDTGTQINNCRCSNQQLFINTSFDVEVNNHDHVDRLTGVTNTTTGLSAVTVNNSSQDVKVNGITFGVGGAIANVHPNAGVVTVTNSRRVRARNAGTREVMLSTATAPPTRIFVDGGNNSDVKIQRMYLTNTLTSAWTSVNTSADMVMESVFGTLGQTSTVNAGNMTVRGCGNTNTTTGQASVYGSHWQDAFTADTTGRLLLAFNEPSAETLYLTSRSFGPGSGFTSAGNLALLNVNDYFIVEMPTFVKGYTAFENSVAVGTGTNVYTNHVHEYQIDTGSGWNGTWKPYQQANLTAESISPSVGFKLKYRVTCTVANTGNLLTYVRTNMVSTLAAQAANLYPLDVNTATFTGLPIGCDVVVLSAGTTTVLAQVDQNPTDSYGYVFSGSQTVDVGFIKPGFIPFYIRGLPLAAGENSSIPVALTLDRNYL